ncbi:MAG: rod shape-determining protein MreC [Actinomycetes bacterium]
MASGGNNRSRLLLVILLVTSLFLITLDLRGVSLTNSSRSLTQSVLAPVQRVFSSAFSPVGNFFADIKNFGKTKAELKDVQAQNEKLKSQIVINEDIKGQLKQLHATLNLAGRGGYTVVAARVIGRGSASTFSQTITIDAGTSDGVTKDMTVIAGAGLVGVVKSATSSSAIVLLMSDPSFRIGVRIAGTQSAGVLLGQGDSSYLLQLLDPAGSIAVGDVLVSLGSDNARPFVPGIPVGRVTGVDHTSASLTQQATVIGLTNLDNVALVSVITKNAKQDPKNALVPTPQPTVTVYVTPAPIVPVPSPGVSTFGSPSPMPSASVTKK